MTTESTTTSPTDLYPTLGHPLAHTERHLAAAASATSLQSMLRHLLAAESHLPDELLIETIERRRDIIAQRLDIVEMIARATK